MAAICYQFFPICGPALPIQQGGGRSDLVPGRMPENGLRSVYPPGQIRRSTLFPLGSFAVRLIVFSY